MKKDIRIGDILCEPGRRASGFIYVGETPSSKISMPVVIVNGAREGPILCITAGVHGTEWAGIVALYELLDKVNPKELNGAILTVPIVNMPGFEGLEMLCPIDGMNISQIFPGDISNSTSSVITYHLWNSVVSKADYYIDLHGGGDVTLEICDMAVCKVTGDEVIDKASIELARAFLSKYVFLRPVSPESRSLKDEASKKGIILLTPQSGRSHIIQEKSVDFHIKGLVNVLKYLKMLKGNVEKSPEQKFLRPIIEIRPKHGGLFFPKVKAGFLVTEGQILAEVKNVYGETIEKIKSPADGLVYYLIHSLPVVAGKYVIGVAQDVKN